MINVYWYTVRDSFKANPALFCLNAINSIFRACSAIGLILFLQLIFEAVEESIGADVDTKRIIILLCIFTVITILNEVFDALSNLLPNYLSSHTDRYTQMEFYKKASCIDPIYYEIPQYLDTISKANKARRTSIWTTNNLSFLLFFHVPYLILTGVYLHSIEPVMMIALIFAALPVLIAQILRMKATASHEDEVAPLERQCNAYVGYLTSRDFFKDTRLLGLFSIFKQKYIETVKLLNKKIWKTRSKTVNVQLLMSILSMIGFFGVIVILFWLLIANNISVGAFSAAFVALNLFFNQLERLFRDNIGTLFTRSGVISNYVKFMHLAEKQEEINETSDNVSGIILNNVSFQYPGSDKFALKNINLNIKVNEKLAIVGENGAGKSTLVKIIIGLYQPSNGSVFNSITKTSAVFQNYQRYKMTLKDNIEISDNDSDDERICYNATLSDVPINEIETFPHNIDTMLSRDFGGVDLSGGQWQRVALARGLYRNHNLMIFDEPTAAIDPIEETALFNKFVSLTQDKTALLVTHRLGSTRIADRIIVLHDGQIIEEGTHDELRSMNGVYEKMYKAQSEWYERK